LLAGRVETWLDSRVPFVQESLELGFALPRKSGLHLRSPLRGQLVAFKDFGKDTRLGETVATTFGGERVTVATYTNEFWTAKQRAASSLHEVSYRACFKPQLARFFIDRLTEESDVVYDPFMGRGTTLIEAALLGRVPCGCDVNPLSAVLTKPRLRPPELEEIVGRLGELDYSDAGEEPEDLLVFYHRETLRQVSALRKYLQERVRSGRNDHVDDWIRMVAVNRLTGHSPGFFSVYTMPPNQAVSVIAQRKINEKRGQEPSRKNVAEIIGRKSRQLLSDCTGEVRRTLSGVAYQGQLLTQSCDRVSEIKAGSVSLVVTSPPFLDVVDYAGDNWLRCWFIGVDPSSVRLTVPKKVDEWQRTMTEVFRELARVLRPGGHVAFEVGEVRNGKVKLEEAVVPCGMAAGLEPVLVLINDQKFTKTANCWGVDNNSKGTNTNRIVVFKKGE
jgi:hypothetical protein